MIAMPNFRRIDAATTKLDAAIAARNGVPTNGNTSPKKADADEHEPDHHRNAPKPDASGLYGLIGDVARIGSATTEANEFAIALNALAYLGCCVGRGPYLPVGNNYHHSRLFTMHVGGSGRGRKGDAVSLIHRIDMALREIDPNLAPQVHRGGLSSREGLAFLIHDGYGEGNKEIAPINDKRLWVIESEFANVLHQTKRDGNTLSSALRDCWDGVPIKPATKSNRISASYPHVGLSAAVTSGELLSLIAARELSNGFANRFLTIFSERTRLLSFPKATEQTVVNDLAKKVADVLRFTGADRWVDRDHLRLSLAPTAAKLFDGLYQGDLNKQDFGPLVNGLLERRAPVLLRIAMLFALTDKQTLIAEQHVKAAMAWIRYWTDSVQFIFRSAAQEEAQQEVTDAARKIVEFLQAKGRQPRTKITTECFQGRVPKDKIDAALDELLQSTPPKIVVEVEPRTDGPGSGTKFYRLATNSAKSANSVHPRGLQPDSAAIEVCELCEVSDGEPGLEPTRVRTVRTVREVSNPLETRANPHSSLTSHSSRGDTEVEEF